jgi:N-acetylglucosaminyldiphosphoundecaprenol N-acetyl-beta-D-mannosaminyltransferase
MKEDILGYQVETLSVDRCADDVFSVVRGRAVSQRGCAWLACLNPHSYAVAINDAAFAEALRDAEWLVPDGAGIVMASRLLGGCITERVTGSAFFRALLERMNAAGGMSVFFLGASEETLALIRARMAKEFPRVRVAGTYSPPFKEGYTKAENDAMVDAINVANPDVLWVGLTAPKQEKWMHDHRARLQVSFAGAVGAVFDFFAGTVVRPHLVFQRLGLEWLPRLLQQPKRLWRRTIISAPVFVWHVVRCKLDSWRQ